jgi:hypothetical protein
LEAGNTAVSVIRTVPLFDRIGCCAIILWLMRSGTCGEPGNWSEASAPGTGAGKI